MQNVTNSSTSPQALFNKANLCLKSFIDENNPHQPDEIGKWGMVAFSNILVDCAQGTGRNIGYNQFQGKEKTGYQPAAEAFVRDWEKTCLKYNIFSLLDPEAFASSINSHRILGVTPGKEWSDAWLRASYEKLPEFEAKHLVSSGYGLKVLGIVPSQEWQSRWLECSKEKMSQFDGKAFANSIYMFDGKNIKPTKEWLQSWLKESSGKLASFKPGQLTSCMFGLEMCKSRPDAEWLDGWYVSTAKKMSSPAFTPHQFAKSLHCIAWLGSFPKEGWLDTWYKESIKKMFLPGVAPDLLSAALYSHVGLKIQPDREWMKKWYECSEPKLMESSAKSLSNSIFALAALGIVPPRKWLAAWYEASEKKFGEFLPQTFSNSIYGLAILKQLGAEVPEAYRNKLLHAFGQKNASGEHDSNLEKHYSQTCLAYQAFGLDMGGVNYDWIQNKTEGTYPRNVSELEKNFLAAITPEARRLGFTIKEHVWNNATLSHINLVFESPSQHHKLYVQVDGQAHYVRSPEGKMYPDGFTQLQTKLLQKSFSTGDCMQRISYGEMNNLGGVVEKTVSILRGMDGQQQHPDSNTRDVQPEGKGLQGGDPRTKYESRAV